MKKKFLGKSTIQIKQLDYSLFSEFEATMNNDLLSDSVIDINSKFTFVNQYPCYKKCVLNENMTSDKILQTFAALLFLRFVKSKHNDDKFFSDVILNFIKNFSSQSYINIS